MAEISTLNGYKIKDKKAIRYYNTVADMVADTTLKDGMYVKTSGYYQAYDGGHAEYKIANDNLISDNGSIHNLNNGLFAKLIDKNINIKMFGAYGDDNHDDTSAIQNAINKYDKIFIPSGTYLISEQLIIPSNKKIYGIGDSSIIKAKANFTINNDYKALIKTEQTPLESYGSNNILIKDLLLDNNSVDDLGKDGLIHLRGNYNVTLDNITINIDGSNCWGIILFGSNKNININKCNINNNSADNSRGGCIWVRSGINATTEQSKSKNINITNCYLESTAKDELLVIADGVDGGWTECNVDNVTINGISTINHPTGLFIINCISNTGVINANINNIIIKGIADFGLMVGYNDIPDNLLSLNANNIVINIDGKGIRGYSKNYIFNNCNIKSTGSSAFRCTLINSRANNTCESCDIHNCIIDTTEFSNKYCCDSCHSVQNSILKSNSTAIHTYGNFRTRVINNEIFSNLYGINCQNNNTAGVSDSIIIGNYISRLTASDNTGSIAIRMVNGKNNRTLANKYLLKTGSTAGTSLGFNYYSAFTSETNSLHDDNEINV